MRNKKRFMALALSAAMVFSNAVPTGMTVIAADVSDRGDYETSIDETSAADVDDMDSDSSESADLAGETAADETGTDSESNSENNSETTVEEAVSEDAEADTNEDTDEVLSENDVAAAISDDETDETTEEYTYDYYIYTSTDYGGNSALALAEGADFNIDSHAAVYGGYNIFDSDGNYVGSGSYDSYKITDYDVNMWTSLSEDGQTLYGKTSAGETTVTVSAYVGGEAVASVTVTVHSTEDTLYELSYSDFDSQILVDGSSEVSVYLMQFLYYTSDDYSGYMYSGPVEVGNGGYTLECTLSDTTVAKCSEVTAADSYFLFQVTGLSVGYTDVTITVKDEAGNELASSNIGFSVEEDYYTVEWDYSANSYYNNPADVAIGEDCCIYDVASFAVYHVTSEGTEELDLGDYSLELNAAGEYWENVDNESGTFIGRTYSDRFNSFVNIYVGDEYLGSYPVYFGSVNTYELEYSREDEYLFCGTPETFTITCNGEALSDEYTVDWIVRPFVNWEFDSSYSVVTYSVENNVLTLSASADALSDDYEGVYVDIYAYVYMNGQYVGSFSTDPNPIWVKASTYEITNIGWEDDSLLYSESTRALVEYTLLDSGETGEATITNVEYVTSEWYDSENEQPDVNAPDSFMEISRDADGNWYVTSKMTENNYGTVWFEISYLDNNDEEQTSDPIALSFVREDVVLEGMESSYKLSIGDFQNLDMNMIKSYVSYVADSEIVEEELTISYATCEIGDESIVNAVFSEDYSTLTLTGLKAGTTVISIEVWDANGYYAGSGEITITVLDDPELTGTTSHTYTYGNPSSFYLELEYKGDGELVYEVTSGSDILSVDEDGLVTVKGTGTAVITATLTETDTYEGASMEITVTIQEASSSEDGSTTQTESETETETESETGDTTIKEKLVLDEDGVFRYYINGVFAEDFSGVVSYDNGLFFIKNGLIDFGTNELCLYEGVWYYASYGQVQLQYTGLAIYDGAWFYITKGILDTTVNGLVPYNGATFLVAAGRLVLEHNGLWLNSVTIGGDDQWYFIAAGKVTAVSQVVMYDGAWFVVKDGILDTSCNGTIEYDGATFTVVNGQLYG
ncbi:MAG: hypothetical protein LUH00_12955 [Lachnospiraceae bacterium]|nr:hypothetical protein [Lachnospiraceae bacterium]